MVVLWMLAGVLTGVGGGAGPDLGGRQFWRSMMRRRRR